MTKLKRKAASSRLSSKISVKSKPITFNSAIKNTDNNGISEYQLLNRLLKWNHS